MKSVRIISISIMIMFSISFGYVLGDKITDDEIKRHQICTDYWIQFTYGTLQSQEYRELNDEQRHNVGMLFATFWWNNCMDFNENIVTEKMFIDRINKFKSQHSESGGIDG